MIPQHTIRYRQLHIDTMIACIRSARVHLQRGNWAAADFALTCVIAEAKLARAL